MDYTHPYFIFIINIVVIRAIEIVFAAITGILEIITPYVNQNIKPASVMISIVSDKSFVCFDLIVFIAWGRKAKVVKKPAVNPITTAIVSNNYCMANFKFNPASFEVRVGICIEPCVGPIFVNL